MIKAIFLLDTANFRSSSLRNLQKALQTSNLYVEHEIGKAKF